MGGGATTQKRGLLRGALRAIVKMDWIVLAAAIWMTLVVVAAVVGDWIAPYEHAHQNIAVRNLPPGSPDGQGGTHLLGTDLLGRDLLSRIIAGARVSLVVGILSVGTAGLIGTVLGTLAGYVRGRTEAIVMRFVDIQMAIPFLLLALVFLFLFGRSLFNVVLILALLRWPVFARTARSLALNLRTTEFVEAAGMLGYSHTRILAKHMWPNMASPLIVLADAGDRSADHCRGDAQLPRDRGAASSHVLGPDDRARPKQYLVGLVERRVSGSGHLVHRREHEHAGELATRDHGSSEKEEPLAHHAWKLG